MMTPGNLAKFVVLCIVWGLTWIAVKLGVSSLPPLLFAATRFISAGAVFITIAFMRGSTLRPLLLDWRTLVLASLLMITLCYGPLFWGMTKVSSGTAAVLEMSLTPVCLFIFGVVLRQETWSWVALLGMAVGTAGLYLLFKDGVQATYGEEAWLGIVAVSWAAASSALGSVLAKPLIEKHGSSALAGSTTLLGGLLLVIAAIVSGERIADLSPMNWTALALAGWFFLVIFGSLIGYRLYMQLLRDVGPTRAGAFAFVSPMIAVAVGALIAHEPVTKTGLIGMALLLLSAATCLYGPKLGWKPVG
ncbi:EamA family transporter [Rhizobium phaseoli]|uniref:EamA family transporter n=1 Tax=Rhizobium phaseoli TaxID=396 RepID=A0A7K3UEG1_9HYPH|nr:EamA family transporter [Rhizobium phaseoli]NEJ72062.1 EamA family transporter [Rhizobium phaseoli]